jgi:hypothetical protein
MTERILTIGSGTAPAGNLLAEVLPWVLVLIGFVVIASVIIMWLHRRIRSDQPSGGGGFTLHDLRQMHARGELSDAEFQRARESVIAGVRGAKSENEAPTEANNSDAERHDPGENE